MLSPPREKEIRTTLHGELERNEWTHFTILGYEIQHKLTMVNLPKTYYCTINGRSVAHSGSTVSGLG